MRSRAACRPADKVVLMESDNSLLTSAKEPGRGYHDLG
jgi:hypothetical protein